jgi:tRNA 2-thiouridine synthesizing protein A
MAEKVVDCVGLYCPVPIAQAAEALAEVAVGETIEVLADDPGVESDFPSWCRVTGHELVRMARSAEGFRIVIRRKK